MTWGVPVAGGLPSVLPHGAGVIQCESATISPKIFSKLSDGCKKWGGSG